MKSANRGEGLMRGLIAVGVAALFASMAFGQADVGFELPDYTIGDMHGQSGGGIAWEEFEANSGASVAVPGFNSDQIGRWDVKDLGNISDGDDMLGLFDNAQAAIFEVSAMSFIALEPNRPNGTSRLGHFFVSDASFFGTAITWLANGNVGYWGGGGFNILDTGVPAIYNEWVPFRIQMDYNTDTFTMFYNGEQVASDTMTSSNGDFADQLDIWLDTINLVDNPNPGDWAAFDNIVITPEPGTISLLVLGGLALLRRR